MSSCTRARESQTRFSRPYKKGVNRALDGHSRTRPKADYSYSASCNQSRRAFKMSRDRNRRPPANHKRLTGKRDTIQNHLRRMQYVWQIMARLPVSRAGARGHLPICQARGWPNFSTR
jgi:hypothetical protein